MEELNKPSRIEDAKEMLSDPEMKEMAMEIDELKEKNYGIGGSTRQLLIPQIRMRKRYFGKFVQGQAVMKQLFCRTSFECINFVRVTVGKWVYLTIYQCWRQFNGI